LIDGAEKLLCPEARPGKLCSNGVAMPLMTQQRL
jgi:hypothetical protein